MTQARRDAASERQVEAADPTQSTWLAANAGSGKTRVLTDRVARLLLRGVRPENVLCLTYTKAAASEMQNRLFRRLGSWAMLPDDALSSALFDLGAVERPDAMVLAAARRLFARAIETPGGLKIQTIHSFCGAVLRRFPLEAGLSPSFTEMDDATAKSLQKDVTAELALRAPEVVSDLGAIITDEDFGSVCDAVLRVRTHFEAEVSWSRLLAAYGLDEGTDPATLRSTAIEVVSADDVLEIATILQAGSKTMQAVAEGLETAADSADESAAFVALCDSCLVKDWSRRNSRIPTQKAREALGPLADVFDDLADGLVEANARITGWEAARRTHVLHRFAAAFLPLYAEAKAARGLLDFDDLIEKTERLLSTPGVADWVLYRLDGEIEHVLVDEAQDTSPVQWRVIEHLTREFTSGEGMHPHDLRTIFVVGDLKQSIYSFQGAAPESFVAMQGVFGGRLKQIGRTLQSLELEYSFRSAPPILDLVDRTFPDGNRSGLGGSVLHRAFRSEMPGRVEFWPRVVPEEKEEEADWWAPVDQKGQHHHAAVLARQVADKASKIVRGARIPDGEGGQRKAHAGDILVLVQTRGALFDEIISACKAQGLEVAGADRLKLTEELAVKDLLAILRFVDTPEDCLSLAAALRSPIFGWSEAALFDLAHHRSEGAYLWQALRERSAEFVETHVILMDLLNSADFLRPYDLLERILTRHGGRQSLVARLGEEAADGVEALLNRALSYEQREIPSLTGFLAHHERVEDDVKRQAEAAGSKLRVMTVHGAKGLESPIVILPDTSHQKRVREFKERIILQEAGSPLWSGTKSQTPAHVQSLKDEAIDRQLEEARRLLYVAMTRAETWLIVAAAGNLGTHGDTWYEQIEAGMNAAGAVPHPEVVGGLLLQSKDWTRGETTASEDTVATEVAEILPVWASQTLPSPARPEAPLSPSDLGGAKALPGEEALPKEQALARGTILHHLLEHLANVPAEAREALAASLFAPDPPDMGLMNTAMRVLDHVDLAHVFDPSSLAEVPISAALSELGGRRIHGAIDRLIIREERVLAVDFKSNAVVPSQVEEVPEGLLRQMGAYAAALGQIYPGRAIETAILWTETAQLMTLPDGLIRMALIRAHEDVTANQHPSAVY